MHNETKNNKKVLAARIKFYRAVKAGVILPAEVCNRCGKNPGVGKDGRRLIQGHHHNGYDDAFIYDVEWLCPSCHKICHGNRIVTEELKQQLKIKCSKPKNITPEQRQGYAERCRELKPWKARSEKPCPKNHAPNFGINNRGHRFCKDCARENRRK